MTTNSFLVLFSATVLLALVLVPTATHAGCQSSPSTLVSNLFLNSSGSTTNSHGSLQAEAFKTPSGSGFVLDSISILIGDDSNSGQSSVELWSHDADNNRPKDFVALVAVVVNPSSPTIVTISSAGNFILLSGGTTYWFVFSPNADATGTWWYSDQNAPVTGTGTLLFRHRHSDDAGSTWQSAVDSDATWMFMVNACEWDGVYPPSPSTYPGATGMPSYAISPGPIIHTTMPSPVATPTPTPAPSQQASTPTPTQNPTHTATPVNTPTGSHLPSPNPSPKGSDRESEKSAGERPFSFLSFLL